MSWFGFWFGVACGEWLVFAYYATSAWCLLPITATVLFGFGGPVYDYLKRHLRWVSDPADCAPGPDVPLKLRRP